MHKAQASMFMLDAWRGVLTPADHANFWSATNTSLAWLLDQLDHLPAPLIEGISGKLRVLPHPLNAYGLHALRGMVAERLTDAMRAKGRWESDPEVSQLHMQLLETGLVRVPIARVPQPDENASWIMRLLKMVSGLPQEVLLQNLVAKNKMLGLDRPILIKDIFPSGHGELETVKSELTDIQHYMHVDTFQPTWKVWIFGEGTNASSGALHYVRGSHRLTEGKLRWLYNRTRTVTESGARTLTKLNHQVSGPFRDPPPGGGTGAIRYVGFNPRRPHRSLRRSLALFGFQSIEPVTAVSGQRATLVIADTSGLHFRGYAPGTYREQLTLDLSGKRNRNDNVLPRLSIRELTAAVARQ